MTFSKISYLGMHVVLAYLCCVGASYRLFTDWRWRSFGYAVVLYGIAFGIICHGLIQ